MTEVILGESRSREFSRFAYIWNIARDSGRGLGSNFRTGFHVRNEVLYRAWNVGLALFFGVLALPLMVLIALVLKLVSGGPVFYSGVRLGRDRTEFLIHKFRTLRPGAEETIGSMTVRDDSELVLPIGRFLRKTRLDELPQIWNVLKGEMNFIGPRPVRPVIARKYRTRISNYDLRFTVRPGLLGHCQMFIPHGTPKSIRARFNNRLIKRDVNLVGELYLIVLTIVQIMSLVVQSILRTLTLAKETELISEIEVLDDEFAAVPVKVPVRISPSEGVISHRTLGMEIPDGTAAVMIAKNRRQNSNLRIPVVLERLQAAGDGRDARRTFRVQGRTERGQFLLDRHVLSRSFTH